jgi:hypothetical protein
MTASLDVSEKSLLPLPGIERLLGRPARRPVTVCGMLFLATLRNFESVQQMCTELQQVRGNKQPIIFAGQKGAPTRNSDLSLMQKRHENFLFDFLFLVIVFIFKSYITALRN